MSTGVIIAIVVVVIVLAAALTTVMLRPGVLGGLGSLGALGTLGGRSLHRRFGPEYDRVLRRHNGDTKATEKELSDRLRRYGDIKTVPLPTEARAEYTARWSTVQEHFVDSPAKALSEADALIENLVRDRGYPDVRSGGHFDALSVHHARHIQGYRDAHAFAAGQAGDTTTTEEMRAALVHARGMFEALVRADTNRAPSSRDASRDSERKRADEKTVA